MAYSLPTRLRRLRRNGVLRDLVRETVLQSSHLIAPLFVKESLTTPCPIKAMPGYEQLPLSGVCGEVEELQRLGINTLIIFGVPSFKDAAGSAAYAADGIVQKTINLIKNRFPDMLVISDVCFCQYTDHGHCGFIPSECQHKIVDNDATLTLITKQALSHAQAGADVVAPSGMMDGAVAAIREKLDAHGYSHIPILSYSVKYASALYSGFREAAEGAPKFGDRRSYQMDYANGQEAIREAELDVAEGADMLMVKPAHAYLDVIRRVKDNFPHIPLCAYHTSSEFSMIKAATQNGWIDEKRVAIEILTGIRRAGADCIITYYAKEVAQWLKMLNLKK